MNVCVCATSQEGKEAESNQQFWDSIHQVANFAREWILAIHFPLSPNVIHHFQTFEMCKQNHRHVPAKKHRPVGPKPHLYYVF